MKPITMAFAYMWMSGATAMTALAAFIRDSTQWYSYVGMVVSLSLLFCAIACYNDHKNGTST